MAGPAYIGGTFRDIEENAPLFSGQAEIDN